MTNTYIDPEKFYTAVVYLLYESQDRQKILSYANIEGKHVAAFQEKIWRQGIRHVMTTGTIELINPFKIDKVLLTPQDKKIE